MLYLQAIVAKTVGAGHNPKRTQKETPPAPVQVEWGRGKGQIIVYFYLQFHWKS